MRFLLHPARAVAFGFLVAILAGTLLLMLPVSHATAESGSLLVSFFTAVSAVCVTGLVIVDTGTYWSMFGQVIILFLCQIGGFGMMTAATLLGLMVNRSLRLRTKLVTQVETHSLGLGDIGSVAKLVFVVTVVVEVITAVFLTTRFYSAYPMSFADAAWNGVFHAISAFNNAGFSIYPDSLIRFAVDPLILLPIMVAIMVGGIGFPVLHDLRMKIRDPRHWSLHTKLTLLGTGVLLLVGFLGLLAFEWHNAQTLGALSFVDKLWSAAFMSVSARTAGFNALDIGLLNHESWALHYLLMFIGGGSAGTAGGVKVGTVVILVLIVIAEIRGLNDSEAFGRRVGPQAQRQAVTVLVLGSALVVTATVMILRMTDLPTDQVIFEVVSAFGTVGLSTGITADLPSEAQVILAALMYFGRVGTITLATSIVLSKRRMPYRYAEEHPIVG